MEGLGTYNQENREREPDPLLEDLWYKYEFSGNPPYKGSSAESRLKEACQNYAKIVNNLQSSNLYRGDSENYIPPNRAIKRASSSDSKRREIHNKIAVMVVGKERLGM